MIITTLKDIEKDTPIVLTIGSFDGIHLGHKKLLDETINYSKKYNAKSLVLTFSPHPREVIDPEYKIQLLTDKKEKVNSLDNSGIDYLIFQEFNKKFSKLPWETFFKEYILQNLNLKHVITGFNHEFGNKRDGNYELLKKLSKNNNFTVSSVEPKYVNIKNEETNISSTKIRNYLLNGKVEFAYKMLGRDYTLHGDVIEGNKLGRKIGFPTINISVSEKRKLIPVNGVYFTKVVIHNNTEELEDIYFYSMSNIGYKPTIVSDQHKKEIGIETHIFNFDKQIYGKRVCLHFIKKIRDEIKFDSIDELKIQLEKDKQYCLEEKIKRSEN